MTVTIDQLVDLDRYPLDRPDAVEYACAVEAAREGLRRNGCAIVRDLVRPEAVQLISDEIIERKHTTHYSTEVINPYFHTAGDSDLPERHPINTFIERSSGFIPGDSWESGCATDVLFRASALTDFIAACLEVPTLHCYADPLAGLTANILDPGQQFTWHFDTNEFAVTVLVDEAKHDQRPDKQPDRRPDDQQRSRHDQHGPDKQPDRHHERHEAETGAFEGPGGLFEYVPAIRSVDDEGFDAIQRVLEGVRCGVRTLDLRPGDLQIFRGRYSLHRVTRVAPDASPRHAAIFAYTLEPGVIGRVERTRQLFGRVLPEHIAAEEARVRSDALTD